MREESKLAARPLFDERDMPGILRDIEQVLRSGRLILGEQTRQLEEEFATYVGTKHAVAVSSCSAALEIALRAAGSHGREVVVPTNTFVATANAASRAGGCVVLCESDERDANFSVEAAIGKISDRTAAVVVVHVAGFVPRDLDLLLQTCRDRGVAVVEDCAHAHGAVYRGEKAGSLGDVGCFSFYPTKIMTSGTGGIVTTDRDDVAALARSLRHHGQGASLEEVVAIGSNWLMDEVRAVLARAQLKRIEEVIAHRRRVAEAYTAALADTEVETPVEEPDTRAVYYKYPVTLPAGASRDRVRAMLRDQFGIDAGVLYWPPVHKMPAYAALEISLPKTEAVLARRLCLPMHAAVDPADCAAIASRLRACL